MSNNRRCDINSFHALYSNPWLHGQAGSQKKNHVSRRVILFGYEGRDTSAHPTPQPLRTGTVAEMSFLEAAEWDSTSD